MEVTEPEHKIIRLTRADLNNLAEVQLWDHLSSYGNVSLFYMNHPNADYQYTCYVCDQYNTCGDFIQRVMQQTLGVLNNAVWKSLDH